MAPEQAKGRPADKRSDIWAFGCVLYEMLTGRRAFEGEDVADTLATVLKGEPDWNALSDDVPEHIRLLLRRSLEKDRNRRVADISHRAVPHHGASRRLAARNAFGASDDYCTAAIAMETRASPRLHRDRHDGNDGSGHVEYTALDRPAHYSFSDRAAGTAAVRPRSQVLAVSPDGSQIVYVAGGGQLYLRSMTDMNARPIPGTNLDVMSPVFSPDGKWIVFFSFRDSTLKKIAMTGGAPVDDLQIRSALRIDVGSRLDCVRRPRRKGYSPSIVKRRGTGSAGPCPGW